MEKHKFNMIMKVGNPCSHEIGCDDAVESATLMDYKKWLDKVVKIYKIAANMSDVNNAVVLCGFRKEDIGIHIYKGIELLAKAVGEKITVSDHSDLLLEHGFEYEGCRIFQLKEKR